MDPQGPSLLLTASSDARENRDIVKSLTRRVCMNSDGRPMPHVVDNARCSSAARVSVVLCTYNGAMFLEEQIASLLSQTQPPVEIIASDDGSTDDTWSILTAYAKSDPRFKLVRRQPNVGLQRNFWEAFAMVTGDLIAPCDQDDIWHPEKLARLVEAIGSGSLAYCDSEIVDGRGEATGLRISDFRRMASGRDLLGFLVDNSVSGHACVFRRELLDAALHPGRVTYDRWLAMVAAVCQGVVYLNEPLVKFRRHASTATEMGLRKPRSAGLRRSLSRLRAAIEMPHVRNALEHSAALDDRCHQQVICLRAAWHRRDEQWLSFALWCCALRFRKRMFARPRQSGMRAFLRCGLLAIGGKLSRLLPRVDGTIPVGGK